MTSRRDVMEFWVERVGKDWIKAEIRCRGQRSNRIFYFTKAQWEMFTEHVDVEL